MNINIWQFIMNEVSLNVLHIYLRKAITMDNCTTNQKKDIISENIYLKWE